MSSLSSIVVKGKLVKGRVVLIRKSLVETLTNVNGLVGTGFNLINSSVEDITKSVSFKLISRTKSQNQKNEAGKVGKDSYLENNVSVLRSLGGTEEAFNIYFEWDDNEMGTPGAFNVTNRMNDEFFLVSLTLEYPTPTTKHHDQIIIQPLIKPLDQSIVIHPHQNQSIIHHQDQNNIHFVCNSWVHKKTDRVFFANIPYLPGEGTPVALQRYREEELKNLRGDGNGKREKWDRIYDYDVYNDLGFLTSDGQHDHPVLGGTNYPYPRRVRSGRKLIHNNKNGGEYEEADEVYYVPRDENFSNVKTKELLEFGTKTLGERVEPLLLSLHLKTTPNEFNGFEEVQRLYEDGVNLPISITANATPSVLKFPPPHLIQESKFAWMTDEEFARQMIAGVNPIVIRLLKEEDIASPWIPLCNCFRSHTVTKENLEINMNGVKVDKALADGRLFILDYYETFMSYLTKINELPSSKAYATRTFLFLKDDGTLKPLAIELSKSHTCVCLFTVIESTVVLPADRGVESTIWQLAKAHVIVNDTNYHQLISHWYTYNNSICYQRTHVCCCSASYHDQTLMVVLLKCSFLLAL